MVVLWQKTILLQKNPRVIREVFFFENVLLEKLELTFCNYNKFV